MAYAIALLKPLAITEAQSRMNDFHMIRASPEFRRFSTADAARLHRQSRAWLRQQLAASPQPTVVVTHHAPHALCGREEYRRGILSAAFASDLTEDLESGRAAAWICGHTHHCLDTVIGKTRVISNQRGYPAEPVPNFRPDFTFKI
jgi:hypothetical protein